MRHIGGREFKDKATSLLSAGETLVIERHGKPIGFYIPVHARDRAGGQAALDRLGQTVEAVLARTGLTEEELVTALTPDDDLPPGRDELVVDASVLVAEVFRAGGRARLAHPSLNLFLAEQTWGEVEHEVPRRARRLALHAPLTADETRALVDDCFASIQANIMIVPEVAAYAPLEDEARWRVERDPQDWPIVALALALGAAIWTEDGDFLGCGVATWTTRTLSHELSLTGPTDTPPSAM